MAFGNNPFTRPVPRYLSYVVNSKPHAIVEYEYEYDEQGNIASVVAEGQRDFSQITCSYTDEGALETLTVENEDELVENRVFTAPDIEVEGDFTRYYVPWTTPQNEQNANTGAHMASGTLCCVILTDDPTHCVSLVETINYEDGSNQVTTIDYNEFGYPMAQTVTRDGNKIAELCYRITYSPIEDDEGAMMIKLLDGTTYKFDLKYEGERIMLISSEKYAVSIDLTYDMTVDEPTDVSQLMNQLVVADYIADIPATLASVTQ